MGLRCDVKFGIYFWHWCTDCHSTALLVVDNSHFHSHLNCFLVLFFLFIPVCPTTEQARHDVLPLGYRHKGSWSRVSSKLTRIRSHSWPSTNQQITRTLIACTQHRQLSTKCWLWIYCGYTQDTERLRSSHYPACTIIILESSLSDRNVLNKVITLYYNEWQSFTI